MILSLLLCAYGNASPLSEEKPGWPKEIVYIPSILTLPWIIPTPMVCDLNQDGYLEIVFGNLDENIYVFDYKGNSFFKDGHINVTGLAPFGVAVGNFVEGNKRDLEIGALVEDNEEGLFYVWDCNGDLIEGYPQIINIPPGISPLAGPFWAGDLLELAIGNLDWDCEEEIVFYAGNSGRICVWNSDVVWPTLSSIMNVYYSPYLYLSPIVVNINQDKFDEVITYCPNKVALDEYILIWDSLGNLIKKFKATKNALGEYQVVGDLDNDGELEIVCIEEVWEKCPGGYINVGSWNVPCDFYSDGYGTIRVLSLDGEIKPGWPVYFNKSNSFSIATQVILADIDGDHDLEILILAKNGLVLAYHHNGDPVKGWPVQLPVTEAGASSGLSVGDVTGDGKPEIIAGVTGGICCLSNKGELIDKWIDPYTGKWIGLDAAGKIVVPQFGTPVLADIDNDGLTEIIALGDGMIPFSGVPFNDARGKIIHVWKTKGRYEPQNIEWPEYRGGNRHRGEYIFRTGCIVGTVYAYEYNKYYALPKPKPVANAKVEISSHPIEKVKKWVLTDGKGRYKIPKLPPGWYVVEAKGEKKKVYVEAKSKPITVNFLFGWNKWAYK